MLITFATSVAFNNLSPLLPVGVATLPPVCVTVVVSAVTLYVVLPSVALTVGVTVMPLSPSTLVFVAFNWLKFTASVPLVPFDTLVIGLLPALMPSLLMLTGPTVTLLAFTLLNDTFSVVAMLIVPLSCLIAIFLPASTTTLLPGLTK